MIGYLQSPVPYDNTNQATSNAVGGIDQYKKPFDTNVFGAYSNQAYNTGAWFVPPNIDYNSPAHLAAVAALMGDQTAMRGRASQPAVNPAQQAFVDNVALTASRGARKSNVTRP